MKLTLILYLASWLEKREGNIKSIARVLLPFLVLVGVVAGLVMLEPDMGTTMVIILIAIAMFFSAGASWAEISLTGLLALIIGWILIYSSSYRWQRFLTFINPAKESTGAAYHISQALLAIGSGGLWGVGFGQSRQKYLYLPQAHTDSIFAIIGEELGFFRAAGIFILYIILGLRGFRIAQRAPDSFARFLAVGITSWLIFQTLINLSAMLGLLPLTGVTLPFISYGGSSLVINLIAVGILLNISRQANQSGVK